MKQSLIAAVAAIGLASFAHADVGVGYDGSLGGVSGLSLVKTITPTLALQAIGNFDAQHDDAADSTAVKWGTAVRGWYTFASNGPVNGNIGLGVSFGQNAGDWRDATVELPFGADYFINERFSLRLQAGPQFTFGKNWNANIGGPSSFSGDLAVHYWFK